MQLATEDCLFLDVIVLHIVLVGCCPVEPLNLMGVGPGAKICPIRQYTGWCNGGHEDRKSSSKVLPRSLFADSSLTITLGFHIVEVHSVLDDGRQVRAVRSTPPP
jgi:hypothetical protein